EEATPSALAFLALGSSNTTWGGFSLPLDLGIFGAAGCSLRASAEFLLGATTNASGKASIAIPVPPGTPAGVIWCQWAVADAGAPNSLHLAMTKAGKLVVE
ncbi:MAG: hypothetical protein ACREIU_00235, partial [Planctomycetota bacterium]